MGKGLCRVVDLVDKCGKLCRTMEVFHVERRGVGYGPKDDPPAASARVFHVEQSGESGNASLPATGALVFHVELWRLGGGVPGEEDALLGGWRGDGGADPGGQKG